MASIWPKRLLALALALVFAVGFGAASAARRSTAPQGYARVLQAAGISERAAADPVADCLMAATLLRRESGPDAAIDPSRFEALRAYCRANAKSAPAAITAKPAARPF